MNQPIRILLADDHPVVRDGLAGMLSTQPDFSVIGAAGTGREVVDLAARLRPDVILLDLEMPEMDGIEALDQLQTSLPEAAVIVFTAFDTDERILGALQAGARGYLLKGAPRNEIFRAIRAVGQGGSLLEPVVATRLIEHLGRAAKAPADPEDMPFEQLTEREVEVLELLAQGLTNNKIAARLFITERTVKFHVSAILRKLGAGNRTEAVSVAVKHGLIER